MTLRKQSRRGSRHSWHQLCEHGVTYADRIDQADHVGASTRAAVAVHATIALPRSGCCLARLLDDAGRKSWRPKPRVGIDELRCR